MRLGGEGGNADTPAKGDQPNWQVKVWTQARVGWMASPIQWT